MPVPELRIIPLSGMPEVIAGNDVGELICGAIRQTGIEVKKKDVFVVAQKIVSKAEGSLVQLDGVDPSPLARSWAGTHGKNAEVIEVILRQAKRIVRMERGVLLAETEQGYVCANAGVDTSNVPAGAVTLLPRDPDASAKRIRDSLERAFVAPLGVIISDTFGRPWREGLVDVALGVAGLDPFLDYRGQPDAFGRRLEATLVAVADELAAAAELVMGKTLAVPVALIRGFDYCLAEGNGRRLIRPAERDLFR